MKTSLKVALATCAAFLAAFMTAPAFAFPFDTDKVSAYEYLNSRTNHYFLVADAGEKAYLDAGGAGGDWHRTGHQFGVYVPGAAGRQDVCRFYAAGPSTHFFTASTSECDLLRANGWGWTYEGIPFSVETPADGKCRTGVPEVHRLYNNRFQFNDSNHRYVADADVREDLVRQGWTDEGVVFCAWFAEYTATKIVAAESSTARPVAECENEDLNRGSCIAMNNIPAALPTRIVSLAPPAYNHGPYWSNAFGDLTGDYDLDVYTAQSQFDSAAVAAHSFLQLADSPSSEYGVHVSPLDSAGPLASIEPLYQFSTRAPAGDAPDARVFPWRLARENWLDISFGLTTKTARRSDAQSHAYGNTMIEFRDSKSGYAIDVTVLAFATFPPGDFVSAMDPVTGNVFVSTTFGDRPAFGTRINGNFMACDGSGPCALSGQAPLSAPFRFRLTKADFANVIAKARAANPALSEDVTDYLLVNFRFRTGILGNAHAGATLVALVLSIYGY